MTTHAYTIVRDGARLNTMLFGFRRSSKAINRMTHTLAVSCLVHAAEHGNPDLLNKFYKELRQSDQRLFTNYVRKFQHEFTTTITNRGESYTLVKNGEDLIPTDRKFLNEPSRQNGQTFTVISTTDDPDAPKHRLNFSKFAEAELINPTKACWHPFFDTDLVRQERDQWMTPSAFVKRMKSVVTAAVEGPTTIPAKMAKLAKDFLSQVEAMAKQAELNPEPVRNLGTKLQESLELPEGKTEKDADAEFASFLKDTKEPELLVTEAPHIPAEPATSNRGNRGGKRATVN